MNGKLQGGLIIIGVIIFILAIFGIALISSYNGLVSSDTNVQEKWANVQTAYQRRADLIPNIVETVKGYSKYEAKTLEEITALRSGAQKASEAIKNAKTPEELNSAYDSSSAVVKSLNIIVEAYPDLKASENYLDLQAQLEGTENRVKFERDKYNEAVKLYTTKTRSFPTNIVAGWFGFSADKYSMFSAQAGAENAPFVDFE